MEDRIDGKTPEEMADTGSSSVEGVRLAAKQPIESPAPLLTRYGCAWMPRAPGEWKLSSAVTRGENQKYCTDCGSIISARAEICPRCGVRQMSPPGAFGATTASGRSRVAAAIFAILLGGVGIHKFYLGRIWQGVLYLLFCWTFVPAVIGLIEGIVYLTMSDADFEMKYG
ncbi:TM2 domain-containing membrane protein YozV/ribosomal protein L40E [Nitrobacteraceae bacterium AZCC 2161]